MPTRAKPTTDHLPDDQRALVKAFVDATNHRSWWQKYAPLVAFIVGLLTVAGILIGMADARYVQDTVLTEARAEDKDAHQLIRDQHNLDVAQIVEDWREETAERRLLGKDVEAVKKDVSRIDRTVRREH